jgi:hypothetical protein
MLSTVMCDAWKNLQIRQRVVHFVAVFVVNDLAFVQPTTQHRFGNQPMLINIPANVCTRMIRGLDEHITAGSDRPSTLPVRVSLQRLSAFPAHAAPSTDYHFVCRNSTYFSTAGSCSMIHLAM